MYTYHVCKFFVELCMITKFSAYRVICKLSSYLSYRVMKILSSLKLLQIFRVMKQCQWTDLEQWFFTPSQEFQMEPSSMGSSFTTFMKRNVAQFFKNLSSQGLFCRVRLSIQFLSSYVVLSSYTVVFLSSYESLLGFIELCIAYICRVIKPCVTNFYSSYELSVCTNVCGVCSLIVVIG